MKAFLKRLPWFYILFTIYPLLFIWNVNFSQVDPSVVIRPFVFTLMGSSILYAALYIVFRNSRKATLVGTLFLVAFFSYGHIYYTARSVPALEILSHHRTLVIIYISILALGIWVILSRFKNYQRLNRYLNVASLVLVGLQVFQLGYAYARASYEGHRPLATQPGLMVTTNRDTLPDVYFIVLDTYMRTDAIEQDLGFDNTPFIAHLEDLGFYVAKCSRPNYGYTQASVAATLNMNYLPELKTMSGIKTVDDNFWAHVIDKNEVRRQLEGIGYKTVAFRSEFPWLELSDTSVFLGPDRPSIGSKYLYPFEYMYIRSTAAVILDATNSKLNISNLFRKFFPDQKTVTPIPAGVDPYVRFHIDLQLFILSKLNEVPAIAGPKYVYAHIMIPHDPYVFDPNGKIVPISTEYKLNDSSEKGESEIERQGYVNGVQFIDKQIIPILQNIIKKSKIPPIIILQGDHGFRDKSQGRYAILNSYYLPGGHNDIYPAITPVNSFRIILNRYFGANYPLLPDVTYTRDGVIVPETYPDCLP